MKYIDAEKLLALIDTKIQELGLSGSTWVGRNVLHDLRSEVTSLQQEQLEADDSDYGPYARQYPKSEVSQEQPKVDLEKEIDKEWAKCEPMDEGMGLESANIVNEQFDSIARHFYELGLNAGKK